MAQIDILKSVLNDKQFENIPSDTTLQYELDKAAKAINSRRHYIPTEEIPLEEKYNELQIELAISSISRYGAEGQVSHSENGINRSYENGSDYPASMLDNIVPLIGVI